MAAKRKVSKKSFSGGAAPKNRPQLAVSVPRVSHGDSHSQVVRSTKPSPRAKNEAEAPTAEQLRAFIRSKGADFLDDPNITSIGIAQVDGKPCIQFTVAEKVPRDQTDRLEALGTDTIPEAITVNGIPVPTAVVEATYKPSDQQAATEDDATKAERRRRRNPMVPGISVGHVSGGAGTLGTIVYDSETGAPCILSNWHVLHTGTGAVGDRIVQPGKYDDNRDAKNGAGRLLRSHLGPAGDCAIAQIEDRQFATAVLGLGVQAAKIGTPKIGDIVIKSGRTTGVTYGEVKRVDVMVKIPYPIVGARTIGGFEIRPLLAQGPDYDISQPGDSGSVYFLAKKSESGRIVATDTLVGLHFAGNTKAGDDEHALACYAESVFAKLDIGLQPPVAIQGIEDEDRVGYESDFLGVTVSTPSIDSSKKSDIVEFDGEKLIPYTHFSVCLSKARKFAHFVAWMIDGERLRKESRTSMKFKKDPRIDEAHQVGDEMYSNDKLDRGHIARRADLIWGAAKEAKQANADSFYFTNITPQHEAYNQSAKHGLWGELENAIYDEIEVLQQRLVLFGGPILKKNDPEYRGVLLPRNFWKVISYVDATDNKLKAKAYVLTQDDLLSDLEAFDLDPFRLYQLSLEELETRAGIEFGKLKKADTFDPRAVPQLLGKASSHVREVLSRADLIQ